MEDTIHDEVEITLEEHYKKAQLFILESRNTRVSAMQRKLRVGYNKTIKIMDMLVENGVLTKSEREPYKIKD
jgi:DNA segregation ATPase FtsK/SpoIIIE, S-DNA-T family